MTAGTATTTGPVLEPVPAADGGVPAAPSGYRPELDGVRFLAVYLVVAFHAGADRLSGGFVGVDVFFVLSGYLVTGLLLRDLRANGRIRLSRFYSRRFRRLLPAAFVTLLVTGAVFTAVASPVEVADGLRSIRAAFLYVTNWFFIRQSSDYFAADVTNSPVIHFWSLAIEEQFYLLWPLLLGVLYAVTRRNRRTQWRNIRIVIAIAGVASVALALQVGRTDLNRAYYGTDTRAYQLLAGAFLALTPQIAAAAGRYVRVLRVAVVASLGGLVLVASSVVATTPIRRGVLVTFLTCVLLVSLERSNGGVGKQALSVGPIAYLGRISYGTYLWHWPVIVVAREVFPMSPISLFLLASLAGTAFASLSYQVLEGPIRENRVLDRHRVAVVMGGLTLSVLGALVFAPAVLQDPGPERSVNLADVSGQAPVPAGLDFAAILKDRAGPPDCLGRDPERCTLVQGKGPHILLMGDSHAGMLVPAFTEIAKQRGERFSVAIQNTCPWQEGVTFGGPDGGQACREHKDDWKNRLIPALKPDIIVVIGRTLDDPTNSVSLRTNDNTLVKPGTSEYDEVLRSSTTKTIDDLRRGGRKVVIIEPIPYAADADDPLRCLSGAKYLEECRYLASPGPLPSERIYRSLAADDPDVWTLDMDRLVCPYLPICDPIVNGMVVKFDEGHLTATFARSLDTDIERFLVDNRILPS